MQRAANGAENLFTGSRGVCLATGEHGGDDWDESDGRLDETDE
jgi:hypothetical protein